MHTLELNKQQQEYKTFSSSLQATKTQIDKKEYLSLLNLTLVVKLPNTCLV
jgi:hypothetical protein